MNVPEGVKSLREFCKKGSKPNQLTHLNYFWGVMNAILENMKLIEEEEEDDPYNRPSHPLMVVIAGPSGVGKDSVVRAILQEGGENFHFVVTATSRPPRPSEVDGVDYIFVSELEFIQMIEDEDLLEYAIVHDNYKGVPKQQIRRALNSGKDVLMRVDPQGAATLRRLVPNAVFIFLMAESEAAMSRWLWSRNTETAESVQLRLAIARQELKRIHEFDYCVVNRENDLPDTVQQIMAIMQAEKLRVHRQPVEL
jgi:guanylate kinase